MVEKFEPWSRPDALRSRRDRLVVYQGDERWRSLVRGLDQLENNELDRLTTAFDSGKSSLLTDGANYSPDEGKWCALAVALDLPGRIRAEGLQVRNDEAGREALKEFGVINRSDFTTNPISGIRGNAFRAERLYDLRLATLGILRYRAVQPSPETRREWNTTAFKELADCISETDELDAGA